MFLSSHHLQCLALLLPQQVPTILYACIIILFYIFVSKNSFEFTRNVSGLLGVSNTSIFSYEGIFLYHPFYVVYTFSAPIIMNVTKTNTQGGVIVVNGDNFGSNSSLVLVSFNNSTLRCSNVTILQSHHSFQCILGSGFGYNRSAVVYHLLSFYFISLSLYCFFDDYKVL